MFSQVAFITLTSKSRHVVPDVLELVAALVRQNATSYASPKMLRATMHDKIILPGLSRCSRRL